MARRPREVRVRAAPRSAMPVPMLALLALVPGIAAAPFTIVANVHSQAMVHVGGGAFFPQPQVDVQCPDFPGLQCHSQVDGQRIIIKVFHSMTQGEGIESKDESFEDDTKPNDSWWPFGKPDRVSEASNEIPDDSEVFEDDSDFENVSSTTEKQIEEGYDTSEPGGSEEDDRQKYDVEDSSEHNTEHLDNRISDENDSPAEKGNTYNYNSEQNYDTEEKDYGNDHNSEHENGS